MLFSRRLRTVFDTDSDPDSDRFSWQPQHRAQPHFAFASLYPSCYYRYVSNLLQNIHSPEHVKQVPEAQLPTLAAELRNVILKTVSKNGGHLASNLGAVELTIELLRIFSPPADKIIWDVGHQSYSWKLLTGRYELFHTLRKLNGISGFPKPHESIYDASIAGHAGTALSTTMGFAAGRDRKNENSHVVAIIGDASITNGISLEALNNLEDTQSKEIGRAHV